MRRRPSRFSWLAALVVFAGLVPVAGASGQDKSSAGAAAQPPVHAKETPEYRSAIARALQEFSAGNFPEARAAFGRAHEIYPNARTLRGMGLAAFEARNYVEAIELLSAAMENAEQPITEAQRTEARDAIDRAKSYVSRVQVVLSPASAALVVDGEPARLEGGQLILNPGDYRIQAHASGRQPTAFTISAQAGRSTTITISLPPEAGEPRTTGPAPLDSGRSPMPYVLAGTGAALLIGSAITGAMTAGAENDLRSSCRTGTCDEDARDRGRTLQTATNVLLPLGSAILVGGVLWWMLDEPELQAQAASGGFTFGCTPFGCGAQASGSF